MEATFELPVSLFEERRGLQRGDKGGCLIDRKVAQLWQGEVFDLYMAGEGIEPCPLAGKAGGLVEKEMELISHLGAASNSFC